MMAALQLRLQAGLSPTAPEQPKQQPASSSDQQAKQGKKSATNLAAYSDALRNSSTCKHKPKAQPEKPKEKPQARTMQCIAASKEWSSWACAEMGIMVNEQRVLAGGMKMEEPSGP